VPTELVIVKKMDYSTPEDRSVGLRIDSKVELRPLNDISIVHNTRIKQSHLHLRRREAMQPQNKTILDRVATYALTS